MIVKCHGMVFRWKKHRISNQWTFFRRTDAAKHRLLLVSDQHRIMLIKSGDHLLDHLRWSNAIMIVHLVNEITRRNGSTWKQWISTVNRSDMCAIEPTIVMRSPPCDLSVHVERLIECNDLRLVRNSYYYKDRTLVWRSMEWSACFRKIAPCILLTCS